MIGDPQRERSIMYTWIKLWAMAKHQHIESGHDHGLLLGYQYTTNIH